MLSISNFKCFTYGPPRKKNIGNFTTYNIFHFAFDDKARLFQEQIFLFNFKPFFLEIASSSLTSIELVQSTVSPGQASESLLDLREYPLARGAQSLSDIFEKLLDKNGEIS